jgi:sodium-dependent dicarboxylate transporter 2/3/5
VGSPPNLIGRGLIEEATGERISFAQWTATAAPLCLAMFVVLALIMFLLNKPEVRRIEGVEDYIREQRAAQGRMSRAEINTLIAFGFTVTLWLLPAVVSLAAGTDSALYALLDDRLDEGIVAVLGASLLFILPTNWKERRATLTWADAARIDWGTIILFGTGIIFGSLLAATGLAETIGTAASQNIPVTNVVAITAFSTMLAILISETTSNTASAAVVVPIVIPLCTAIGVDPFVPALAATFAASFGFMLPVSTPQNAIVYGSGTVPIIRMIRTGVVFDIIGALLIIGDGRGHGHRRMTRRRRLQPAGPGGKKRPSVSARDGRFCFRQQVKICYRRLVPMSFPIRCSSAAESPGSLEESWSV